MLFKLAFCYIITSMYWIFPCTYPAHPIPIPLSTSDDPRNAQEIETRIPTRKKCYAHALVTKRLAHESQSRVHVVTTCVIAAYASLNMGRERNCSRLLNEMMGSLLDRVDVALSIGKKTMEHYSRVVTVLMTQLLGGS